MGFPDRTRPAPSGEIQGLARNATVGGRSAREIIRRLRSEIPLWIVFRTGVRLSSAPPNGIQANIYFFNGGFAVLVWL